MDDIDRAQAREELDRGLALAAHARPLVITPADGRCVECGEPIELQRIRVLGATEVCAACAVSREKQAAIRGGRRG